MMYSQFSVSWNEYDKNICKGLGALQQKGEFVDMTIAADGHHVKVHQMVMSLVSPYIKELITSAPCQHPIIFLNKISHQTMESILEYAYTGEVIVKQEKFTEFLEACKDLHIKGLDAMMKPSEILINDVCAPRDDTKSITQVTEDNDCLNTDNTVELQDTDSFYHSDDDNDNVVVETVEIPYATTGKKNNYSDVKYTLSSHGKLQIIVNRFLYSARHTRKNNQRFWRCISQQRIKCPAFVATNNDDEVLERKNKHNHTFHDSQILKKTRAGNVFTNIKEAEAIAKKKKHNDASDSEMESYLLVDKDNFRLATAIIEKSENHD